MLSHNRVILCMELYKIVVSKLLYMCTFSHTFSHTLYVILTVLLFSVMKEIFTNLCISSISVHPCTTTIEPRDVDKPQYNSYCICLTFFQWANYTASLDNELTDVAIDYISIIFLCLYCHYLLTLLLATASLSLIYNWLGNWCMLDTPGLELAWLHLTTSQ